ncbi:Nicotianamine aminotransferase B [Vitis vinifera]|uniref:Nicotianamine aminotransferase B n=1 Tax=Vitis vinifera TaxID=29760 RepID=A0A438K5L0_VITVI|nr:Nicotianamine aminotransferase B [Vitis vinifera]
MGVTIPFELPDSSFFKLARSSSTEELSTNANCERKEEFGLVHFQRSWRKQKRIFFSNTIIILGECADIIHERIKDILCITCPQKPEGSMFVMVKLNLSLLEDIDDDVELCMKLSKEESVIVLTGVVVGMKNWPRVTFAIDRPSLEDGLGRIKAFYQRHMLRRNKDFISDQFNAC